MSRSGCSGGTDAICVRSAARVRGGGWREGCGGKRPGSCARAHGVPRRHPRLAAAAAPLTASAYKQPQPSPTGDGGLWGPHQLGNEEAFKFFGGFLGGSVVLFGIGPNSSTLLGIYRLSAV